MGPRLIPIGVLRTVAASRPEPILANGPGGREEFKTALAQAASEKRKMTGSERRESVADSADEIRDAEPKDRSNTETEDKPQTETNSDASLVTGAIPITVTTKHPAQTTGSDPAVAANQGVTPTETVDSTTANPAPVGADGTESDSARREQSQPDNARQLGLNQGENSARSAPADTSGTPSSDLSPSLTGKAESTTDISKWPAATLNGSTAPNEAAANTTPSTVNNDAKSTRPLPNLNPAQSTESIARDTGSSVKTTKDNLITAESAAARRELQAVAQEQPSDTAPAGETAFQAKVRRWIDGRREGASDESGNRDSQTPPTTAIKPATLGLKKSITRFAANVEFAAQQIETRVTGGKGDGVAASVARLLVHGQPDAGSAAAANGNRDAGGTVASVSSPPVVQTGSVENSGVAATSPSTAVLELLTSAEDSNDAVNQVARVLNANGRSGRYQATMQLDPPELGSVKVQIRMQADAMTLHVQAENRSVSRLIESRLGDLREALAGHGIRVDRAEVVVRAPEASDTQSQPNPERNQPEWQRNNGESFRSPDQHGDWSQDHAWRGAREDSHRPDAESNWIEGGSETQGGDQDRRMPILDGSVNLVA